MYTNSRLLLFTLSIFILACSNEPEKKHPERKREIKQEVAVINYDSLNKVKLAITKKRLDFSKVEKYFKYTNITQIDSSNAFEDGKFKKLSEQEFFEAFQDSSLSVYYEGEPVYFYSNQGEWNGYKRYIFVMKDEVCCTTYYYNIYDNSGKKTDSFIFVASGGEGGWTIDEDTHVLNDSTITKTSVECEYGDDQNNKPVADCDSIISTFHLLGDGKVKNVVDSKHSIEKRNF